MKIKSVISLLLVLALALCLVSCGETTTPDESYTTQVAESETAANDAANGEYKITNTVEIKVKNYGSIIVDLYGETAPISVSNFMGLVDGGFYDGLTFQRIIPGFMIQGGDPNGNGTGGSGVNIFGEFAANGFDNPISHLRGTISMARGAYDYNSASSQFFIMHTDMPEIDGQYAAFGRVRTGIEVVDAICDSVPIQDDNGTVLSGDQPVIEYIKEVEEKVGS